MRYRFLFLSFLGLIMFHTSNAQSTIAKLKYEDAEEAYSKGDYATALNKLDEAEKLFGKINPPIVYLRIIAQEKMISLNKSADRDLLSAVMENAAFYLKEYEHTKGIEDKYKEVYKLNEKLGELSNANIIAELPEYKQGMEYYWENKYTEALSWLKIAADKGNADAMFYIGFIYHVKMRPANFAEAAIWYQRAVQKLNPGAMYALAGLYESGRGLPQNYNLALELYAKASDLGYSSGSRKVGNLYKEGKGVNADIIKAIEWYSKGAAKGDVDAMIELGIVYYNGTGISEDYAKANEWFLKAAEQKNSWAMYIIGKSYLKGTGLPVDYNKAAEWFLRSAQLENVEGMNAIGELYQSGTGVKADYIKAMEWYLKAADKGYSKSMMWIGHMYRYGLGVKKDKKQADEWQVKYEHAKAKGQ